MDIYSYVLLYHKEVYLANSEGTFVSTVIDPLNKLIFIGLILQFCLDNSFPTTALIFIVRYSLFCVSDKILKSSTLLVAFITDCSFIIVFELIAENPLTLAPPFKAAKYIASSKALFLEVSIFSGSKIDLPVASTCLKLDLSCAYNTELNASKAINIKILYILINVKIILFIIYF